MASEKQVSNQAHEHTDQSIKARKGHLFESPKSAEGTVKARAFSEYVKNTPPAPMAPAVKVALWAVAVLVTLLFLASLFGGRSRGTKGRQTGTLGGEPRIMMAGSRGCATRPWGERGHGPGRLDHRGGEAFGLSGDVVSGLQA